RHLPFRSRGDPRVGRELPEAPAASPAARPGHDAFPGHGRGGRPPLSRGRSAPHSGGAHGVSHRAWRRSAPHAGTQRRPAGLSGSPGRASGQRRAWGATLRPVVPGLPSGRRGGPAASGVPPGARRPDGVAGGVPGRSRRGGRVAGVGQSVDGRRGSLSHRTSRRGRASMIATVVAVVFAALLVGAPPSEAATVITGTVKSKAGQPLPGLALLEKGEIHNNVWDRGALVGPAGRFRIEVADGRSYCLPVYPTGDISAPTRRRIESG